MRKFIITIGYIPRGCKSERIFCGDPEYSGTQEHTVEIEGASISCGDNEKSLTADDNDWFNPNAYFWEKFTVSFCDEISGGISRIAPKVMGQCWSYFQDEGDLPDGTIVVSEDGDGGEFCNHKYGNGTYWYVRFQIEEDEEYYNEKVVLIKSEK
jgi:hypothetical protein